MESNIKLTIIVAIYGVEDYIEESIKSFIPQLNKDTECIFVNDGTKDSSMEILHRYLIENDYYKYVKIIEQNNQGLSVARNNAIKQARGKYITFIDADDCVVGNYVDILLNIINKNKDIDLIHFNGFVENKSKKINILKIVSNTGLAKVDCTYLLDVFQKNKWFACFRVFRKELLKDFNFPSGFYYSDMLSIPFLYSNDLKVYDLAEPLYIYKYRSTSSVRMKLNDKHLRSLEYGLKKFRDYRDVPHLEKVYIHLILGLFDYYLSRNFRQYLNFLNQIKNSDLDYIKYKIDHLHWKKAFMLRFPKIFYMYKNHLGLRRK